MVPDYSRLVQQAEKAIELLNEFARRVTGDQRPLLTAASRVISDFITRASTGEA